jgi:hypothetical protein
MKTVTKLLLTLLILGLAAIPALAQTGNGAPNGSHYNLNIIGMADCKSAAMTDSNRHTIFVLLNYSDATPTDPTAIAQLSKKNKIFLQEGSFQVIDGNACDGAVFQLPQNDCTSWGTTGVPASGCTYDVFVRGLGSPQNDPYANMTTCRIDNDPASPTYNTYQCSTETVTVDRNKGKSTFENVTRELTSLCLDTNADTVCDTRVQLFTSEFYQYFWDYDNHGLRLAQLRFYPRVP